MSDAELLLMKALMVTVLALMASVAFLTHRLRIIRRVLFADRESLRDEISAPPRPNTERI